MKTVFNSLLVLDGKDDGRISRFIFFACFGIWAAIKLLQKTFVLDTLGISLPFFRIRLMLLSALILREILFGHWDRRAFIGLVVFVSLAVIAYRAGWNHLVDGACLIFAARNIPFRKIALFSLVEIGALVCLVIALSSIGLFPTMKVMHATIRHSLGFTWVNTAASYAFYLLCLWAFLRGEKYKLLDAGVSLAIAIALFLASHSRAAFISTLALILLALILPPIARRMEKRKLFIIACASSVAVIAIATSLLAIFFDPSIPWMSRLNNILSWRLALAHSNIIEDGIPLFGQKVSMGSITKDPANLVDCLYPKLLIHCGSVFFVITLILCTIQYKTAASTKDGVLIAIFIAIALHAISEPFAAYLFMDPFLFLLAKPFSFKLIDPPPDIKQETVRSSTA